MTSNTSNPEDPFAEPQCLPYYFFFPDLRNLGEVVKFLSDHIDTNGAFILRNSSSGKNYTLTVVHKGGLKHIKIQGQKGSYWLASKRFKRLSELVTYYGSHDVPNIEEVSSVRLTLPITQYYGNCLETTVSDAPPSPVTPVLPVPKPRMKTQFSSMPNLKTPRSPHNGNPAENPKFFSPNQTAGWGQNAQQFDYLKSPSETQAVKERQAGPAVVATSPLGTSAGGNDSPGRRDVRPPPPPPIIPAPPTPHSCHLYAYAINLAHNHTEDLIDALKTTDKCECGLYIMDAMLPEGWAVHLTQEGSDKVFFVSPDNESSWSLPSSIKKILEPHHISVLKKYNAL